MVGHYHLYPVRDEELGVQSLFPDLIIFFDELTDIKSYTVADAKGVAYVDMTALTAAELSKVGKDAAHAMYVGDSTRNGKPTFDTTHPSKPGAKRFAELFVADVKARKLPVAKLFK